jgi:glycosyltransferase involved in cell wall biosynthesis
MTTMSYSFPSVSLLITHYNRSSSLERLLRSFLSLGISFGEIVVSDDGSRSEHLQSLQHLQTELGFRLITTPINKGLGNNINKGQEAVSLPYTLYVQEDFEPAADFATHFTHAFQILEDRQEIHMARFYAYFKYPYLKPIGNGFSDMIFRIWYPGYKKFYYYSDHPHLRRSDFLQQFGRYTEGVKGDVTEYRMMMSFLQKKGKAIYFDRYQDLFYQKNSANEPSTMKRTSLRESNNPFIFIAREIYRHLKFNFDYWLRKF